jgi:hypothetical protein
MRGVMVVAWVLVASVALAGPSLKVPNLAGKTLAEATALMKSAGFLYEPEPSALNCGDNAPDVEDQQIQCQDPDPGTVVEKNKLVEVAVRHGGHRKGFVLRAQLAPLLDHSVAYVTDALKKLGFVGTIEVKADANGECFTDHVCRFEPFESVDIHGHLLLHTSAQ